MVDVILIGHIKCVHVYMVMMPTFLKSLVKRIGVDAKEDALMMRIQTGVYAPKLLNNGSMINLAM